MTTCEIVVFIKYLTTTAIGIVKHKEEGDNGHTQLDSISQHQQLVVT
jgi:hypothetical protein